MPAGSLSAISGRAFALQEMASAAVPLQLKLSRHVARKLKLGANEECGKTGLILHQSRGLKLQQTRLRTSMVRSGLGVPGAAAGGSGALTPELKVALDKFVADNKVVLFMKGTKLFPQCGFSNTCVQILNLMSVPYETVNILEDDQLRQAMKEYSAWPTFPQLYIDGEFFGGCDITVEAFQKGELKELLDKALLS